MPNKVPESSPTYAPNWKKWRRYGQVTLSEAVALSCNIDPEHVAWVAKMRLGRRTGNLSPSELWSAPPFDMYAAQIPEDLLKDFEERLDIAASHVQARKLETTPRSVNGSLELSVFWRWAKNLGLALPQEFLEFDLPSAEMAKRHWPWGTYETPLLVALAAAGAQFFSAPTSEPPQKKVVTAWLLEHGVKTGRTAQVIAQILCG